MRKTRLNNGVNELRAPTPPLPEYDRDNVDEAVLALLYLVLHQPGPYLAWKGFDWATLDRLHAKGMIDDPKHTKKLVDLTDEGMAEAVAVFQRLFGVDGDTHEHLRVVVLGAALCVPLWDGLRNVAYNA